MKTARDDDEDDEERLNSIYQRLDAIIPCRRHGYDEESCFIRHAQRLICEFDSTEFRADTDWP